MWGFVYVCSVFVSVKVAAIGFITTAFLIFVIITVIVSAVVSFFGKNPIKLTHASDSTYWHILYSWAREKACKSSNQEESMQVIKPASKHGNGSSRAHEQSRTSKWVTSKQGAQFVKHHGLDENMLQAAIWWVAASDEVVLPKIKNFKSAWFYWSTFSLLFLPADYFILSWPAFLYPFKISFNEKIFVAANLLYSSSHETQSPIIFLSSQSFCLSILFPWFWPVDWEIMDLGTRIDTQTESGFDRDTRMLLIIKSMAHINTEKILSCPW